MTAIPPKGSFTNTAAPAKTGMPTGEQRLRPLWIPRAECINVKTALAMFQDDYQLSEDTLRRLIHTHRIGNRHLGRERGQWRISAPGLAMALDGDDQALELLRQDDRKHPDVVRYFVRLGIPIV